MNNTVSAKSIIATLLLTFMLLFAVSCSNSRTKTLSGTWEMTEYRINSFDEHEGVKVFWTFKEDGEFSQLIRYPGNEEREEAKWALEELDTLKISYHAKKMEVKWKIAYLDESTLKVEHITPGFFVERSFKKQ